MAGRHQYYKLAGKAVIMLSDNAATSSGDLRDTSIPKAMATSLRKLVLGDGLKHSY